MSNQKNYTVNFDKIDDMLGDDPAYLEDFCQAAITSFTTFKNDYSKSMRSEELEELKKVGHRIKPVAQMMDVNQLIIEYEKAKEILVNDPSDSDIRNSIKRVHKICDAVISDFNQKLAQL